MPKKPETIITVDEWEKELDDALKQYNSPPANSFCRADIDKRISGKTASGEHFLRKLTREGKAKCVGIFIRDVKNGLRRAVPYYQFIKDKNQSAAENK